MNLIRLITVIFFAGLPLMLSAKDIKATNDTITTKEVIVTAEKNTQLINEAGRQLISIDKSKMELSPANNLTEVLKNSTSIDIRSRGTSGSQADIIFRGGTFDQTLVMINGISVNDAQTGHHNANLPIDINSVSAIEVLGGSSSRIYGPNAFTGAVNFITLPSGQNSVNFSLTGGSNQYYKINLGNELSFGSISNTLSINKEKSDGYTQNTDLENINIYDGIYLKNDFANIHLDFGYNAKSFGANKFYSQKYPDQFEKTNTLFSSLSLDGGELLKYSGSISFRTHNDKFELFRNAAPDWYTSHNYHKTNTINADTKLKYYYENGATGIGASFRYEGILSNVLGEAIDAPIKVSNEDAYFTKEYSRNSFNTFFEQNFYFNSLTISLGILGNYTEKYGFNLYPGVDAAYSFSENGKLYTSFNVSQRFPTFTDLFYNGPMNKGNIDLKPEKAVNFELGFKNKNDYISFNISSFIRLGSDMIDWAKRTNDTTGIYYSRNIANVNAYGIECSLMFDFTSIICSQSVLRSIQVSYSAIDMSAGNENKKFISAYVLDYMKHKLFINTELNFYDFVNLNAEFILENRNGNYTEFGTNEIKNYPLQSFLNLKMSKKINSLNFYVSGNNLFNNTLVDYAGLPLAGREVFVGVSYKLNWD